MRKLVKKGQRLTKGTPAAVVISILIHAALFLLATVFVVFTVVKHKEVEFEPPKPVERPKMKLRKPKVRVRKSVKPRPSTHIVTKVQKASMPDIQLPEMSGMTEGISGGIGGFDVMPDLDEVSVFGSGQTIGNDFVGTFYDFKQDRNGRPIPFSGAEYMVAVRRFIRSGWKQSSVMRYYRSPKKRYAICFVIPLAPSSLVPSFFDEPDIPGAYWMTLYKGKLVSKEGMTFRFMGWGDGSMAVRVDGKIVVMSGWLAEEGEFWQSSSVDDRRWQVSNGYWAAGDWITLEPGKPLDMEVLFAEGGGLGALYLAVQQKGVEYPHRPNRPEPIFPAFKTAQPSRKLLDMIYMNLPPNEVNLTNGPVFCDYDYTALQKRESTNDQARVAATNAPQSGVESPPEPEFRTWTTTDGKSVKAKYIVVMGGQVVLKTARGRQVKVPLDRLVPEDRTRVELLNPPRFKIDFSTKKEQIFEIAPDGSSTGKTMGYYYTAKVRLRQTSAGKYMHRLRVEFFAIGKEVNGNRYILLDRQEGSFVPGEEKGQSFEFSGRKVHLPNYWIDFNKSHQNQHRGQDARGYLVTVTDERGKIIQHEESSPWLFEHIDRLRQLPVGAYMDKDCLRTSPTPPPPVPLEDAWGNR